MRSNKLLTLLAAPSPFVILSSRCSVFPSSGSSRTVRRIQTACILSLMALLGSVSMDLSSNFELLNTTEAAYNELTSCRTLAILQLVSELQKTRRVFAKHTGNDTQESNFPDVVFSTLEHLCSEMSGHRNKYGFSCSVEMAGFCPEIRWTVQEYLDGNSTSENRTSDLTLVIGRLLEVWGSTNDTLVKVKQSSIWTDVLSARLVVTFTELNHQLMDFPHIEAHSDFQHKWTSILACLGFATFLSERLANCWLENIDLEVNSSQFVKNNFEAHFWPISGTETVTLSGSQAGIRALTNTQQCLFDSAVPALRLASRSVSSSLSMKICLLGIACLIYPVVMFSFKQMAEWIQNYARTLKEKTEDLKRQRQLAENLLHQMLPKSVAKQLRQNKHVEAESYDKVGKDDFPNSYI